MISVLVPHLFLQTVNVPANRAPSSLPSWGSGITRAHGGEWYYPPPLHMGKHCGHCRFLGSKVPVTARFVGGYITLLGLCSPYYLKMLTFLPYMSLIIVISARSELSQNNKVLYKEVCIISIVQN